MKLSELSPNELRHRLTGPGLCLRTGEFVYSIRSPVSEIAKFLGLLYADFPLAADDAFADFHVALTHRRRFRFWKPPEADFTIGGQGCFNLFPSSMQLAYFEWGLNWCVANLAHHRLVMHAATLERDGRAVIVAGTSGAGKSTLSAAMAIDGWRLLSDEFALISPADLRVDALARPISLKNQSIDLISARDPHAVWGPPGQGGVKGKICHLKPQGSWVNQMDDSADPAWLLLLDFQPGAKAQLQPAAKGATMMQLIAHSFNYYLLGERGFETLGALVDRCDCFRFTYGDLDAGLAMLREMSQSHAKV